MEPLINYLRTLSPTLFASREAILILCLLVFGLGVTLLFFCIRKLGRFIFPRLNHNFSANATETIALPAQGRYVISVVLPPLKVWVGASHFFARFTVRPSNGGINITYQPFGKFNLLTVKRTDMRGHTSLPLGYFHCTLPGDHLITCTTPELIRPEFRLNVAPYVNPLALGLLIPATILSSAVMLLGLITTLGMLTG